MTSNLLELANKLEATYADWNPADPNTGAGGCFATMCLMSDAITALELGESLVGNARSPRELVAALRARADGASHE